MHITFIRDRDGRAVQAVIVTTRDEDLKDIKRAAKMARKFVTGESSVLGLEDHTVEFV